LFYKEKENMSIGLVRKGTWLLGLLVLLGVPALAAAGGWSVLTLNELPAEVRAGAPVTIGFMIRQHGQHPVSGLEPTVTAVHKESGESFTAAAEDQGAVGHYVATITFPRTGTWRWSINGFGDHPMPDLDVQAATGASVVANGRTQVAGQTLSLALAVAIVSLFGAVVALFVWLRTRTRWALAMTLAAVVVSSSAFMARPNRAETAVAQSPPAEAGKVMTTAEVGAALFVAKGCITCHQHGGISGARSLVSVGPNLTHYRPDPEFVHSWLKDPAAIKPGTAMPNLRLAKGEIEALIAFLSVEEE
jgi:cytochrome c2